MRKVMALLVVLLMCVVMYAPIVDAMQGPVDGEIRVMAESSPWWLDTAEVGLNWLWKLAIPAFFAWLIKKTGDSEAMKDALRSVEIAVNDAWVNLVRDLKAKAADGKLTKDEKEQARAWARNKAMEIAKGPGKKVLSALGQMGVDALIEKAVKRSKAEAK